MQMKVGRGSNRAFTRRSTYSAAFLGEARCNASPVQEMAKAHGNEAPINRKDVMVGCLPAPSSAATHRGAWPAPAARLVGSETRVGWLLPCLPTEALLPAGLQPFQLAGHFQRRKQADGFAPQVQGRGEVQRGGRPPPLPPRRPPAPAQQQRAPPAPPSQDQRLPGLGAWQQQAPRQRDAQRPLTRRQC
jgi:hypothetical protein